jgi:hypothetical protein
MSEYLVVDTCVLVNAERGHPADDPRRRRREAFLAHLATEDAVILLSAKLLAEYNRQLPQTQSDALRRFFETADMPGRSLMNWSKRWGGAERSQARGCGFPAHDDHLLRTALRDGPSTLATEEQALLRTDRCIQRHFDIHVHDPAD